MYVNIKSKGVDTWVGSSVCTREKILTAAGCGATLITCNNPEDVLSILLKEYLRDSDNYACI